MKKTLDRMFLEGDVLEAFRTRDEEFCSHCGRWTQYAEYTQKELHDRIMLELFEQPSAKDLIAILVAGGFRASDVKREVTELWLQKKIFLSDESCWIIAETGEEERLCL